MQRTGVIPNSVAPRSGRKAGIAAHVPVCRASTVAAGYNAPSPAFIERRGLPDLSGRDPLAGGRHSFFHEGFRDDSLSAPLPWVGPPVIGNQTIPSPTGTPTSRPGCSLPLAQPDASGK